MKTQAPSGCKVSETSGVPGSTVVLLLDPQPAKTAKANTSDPTTNNLLIRSPAVEFFADPDWLWLLHRPFHTAREFLILGAVPGEHLRGVAALAPEVDDQDQ